ncbi:MAG: tRNA 2-selenouridine(34) synthase MnmH, partial [Pseudazoarcus pumilus]|nr:tRNA 2-selenouridine(34) synthase MnmH [Pseudazoarcus pumilus]
GLQSNETLDHWKELAAAHALPELYGEFIDKHYDPLYKRSQNHNYVNFSDGRKVATDDLTPAGIAAVAREIVTGS